ncbi:hypothetical protein DFH29DRAFT_468844 [Suillus ampliporus]|nr:hypothetical protein DFH29DRAFT_468844 [Suillus ampliporus]
MSICNKNTGQFCVFFAIFLLNARWRLPKVIYLICRYLPFALVIIDIYRIVQPGLSVKSCTTCSALNTYIGGIVLCCAEPLFMIRVWGLMGRKRWGYMVMCCNAVFLVTPIAVVLTLYNSSSIVLQSPIPKVASCYTSREGRVVFVAYILLVVGELEILGFMLYHCWELYRDIGNTSPLVRILVRQNIFYFACGLFFSTSIVVIILTLPASYGYVASDLQIVIHGILATRMHRELWNTARRTETSSIGSVSLPLVFAEASSEMHD